MNQLNLGIKRALKQDNRGNDDGMDVCLCSVQPAANDQVNISFTGSKRPLYYVKLTDGKLETIAGDVKSLGSSQHNKRKFTCTQLELSKGDMLYLTSDGFADQNDQERNKIGTVRFLELLEQSASHSVEQQKQELEKVLELHKEGVEQRDDITILGVRI
jgi:serine phosphatase RsbU (regulator of sigma subunit)